MNVIELLPSPEFVVLLLALGLVWLSNRRWQRKVSERLAPPNEDFHADFNRMLGAVGRTMSEPQTAMSPKGMAEAHEEALRAQIVKETA